MMALPSPAGSGGTRASSSRIARMRLSSASMFCDGLLAAAGPARGHVGARQLDELVEVAPHLVIEAAHGRVGPAALVGVGAQVVEDQEADALALLAIEPQPPRDAVEHARAHLGVAVKGHPPVGQHAPASAPCRCRAAAPTSARAASPGDCRTTCLVCSQTSLCRRPASCEKSTVASSSGSTTASTPGVVQPLQPVAQVRGHDHRLERRAQPGRRQRRPARGAASRAASVTSAGSTDASRRPARRRRASPRVRRRTARRLQQFRPCNA